MATPSKKFIEGLKAHNLTLKDIENARYSYCGGDSKQHLRYWQIKTRGLKNVKRPVKTDKCICGHEIKYNFYISDAKFTNVMVLGSTCIKRFIGTKRTCSVCGVTHKNRSVDRCNECRVGLCDSCDKPIQDYYTKCYYCK